VHPRVEQFEDRTLLASYTASSVKDLINDMNAANTAGGSNTITLAANTSFKLTAVNNTTDEATGLPVIAANDSLLIAGNGDTIQRSNSAPAFRLFDVASGASLTLQNMTLENGLEAVSGNQGTGWGGAISSQGTLVLSAVTVQNNIARGADGASGPRKGWSTGGAGGWAYGGAIRSDGSLTLENGTLIQNNQAQAGNGGDGTYMGGQGEGATGGAIYATGSLTITNSTLSGNVATGGSGGNGAYLGYGGYAEGGAVYAVSATVTISNSTLSSNLAKGGQGGSGQSAGLQQSIFGSAYGGSAYLAGTVVLTSDMVEANQAVGGQGNTSSDPHTLTGNGFGGGLWLSGTATVSGDTVDSNTAQLGPSALGGVAAGGGIYVDSAATVTFCSDAVQSNSDVMPAFPGSFSTEHGGGIEIASGAAVYIDTFTVSNTISNSPNNIDGSYILQNC
jgi:predicted outer membrane repeat protein